MTAVDMRAVSRDLVAEGRTLGLLDAATELDALAEIAERSERDAAERGSELGRDVAEAHKHAYLAAAALLRRKAGAL